MATRPRPVTPDERARVAELHAAGMSRAEIARELDRSPSVVGRIAKDAGLTWDRTRTEAATRARQTDLAARRAELASLLLDDAFRLRERMWEGYELVAFDKLGKVVRAKLQLPPADAVRNFITSVGIAVDKHVALVRVDADTTGRSAVESWLVAMFGDPDQAEADIAAAVEQAGPPA